MAKKAVKKMAPVKKKVASRKKAPAKKKVTAKENTPVKKSGKAIKKKGAYSVYCYTERQYLGRHLTSSAADSLKASHETANSGHSCSVLASN